MKIVVVADIGWAIGRVHSDVFSKLPDCVVNYHNATSFFPDKFMKDFHESDICITTLNYYKDMLRLFPASKDRRKVLIIMHGACEIVLKEYSTDFTYGATSSLCKPMFPLPIYVTPNGVNFEHFPQRRLPPKTIRTLGWCGEPRWHITKRFEMSLDIAKLTHLPISVARSLSFSDLKDWYLSIDLLLVTSGEAITAETGPLPAFEAIASGVPVIGTSVGNFSFVPGPKFSTPEEAASIIAFLTPSAIEDLINAQYAYVRDNFEYTVLAPQWRAAFEATKDKSCGS